MMSNNLKGILLATALLSTGGCAQKQRILTHTSWWDKETDEGSYFYLTYWEGSCQPVPGCSNEESK